MLEQLLIEIRSGGTFEVAALAGKLGTSPAMVEALLAHLQRAGYIHPFNACKDACAGCGLRDGCNPSPAAEGVRLWQT